MLFLRNDRLAVNVSRKGGALTEAMTADGRPFLRGLKGPFDVRASACYPLVPIGNRVGGNRFRHDGVDYVMRPNTDEPLYLHGDGWLADWEAERSSETRLRLALDHLEPAHGPHRYRAEQEIELDGPSLHMRISVENRGSVALPFGIGLHPFFPNDDAQISFSAGAFWTEAPDRLPRDRQDITPDLDFTRPRGLDGLVLNNAYEGWNGHARIDWPGRGMSLELTADPVFSTLMAYAPANDRSFFCLEPMSHLPNALGVSGSAGMHVLAPGQTLSGAIRMTLTEMTR